MTTPRRIIPLAAIGASLLLLASAVAAADTVLHPFLVAQPKQAPQEVNLAVEIPVSSFTKYEIKDDGLVHVDRFQSMPVAYPANYGSMPRTLAGDNDPLDALVLTREPLHPGVIVRFRPIGYLKMIDGGEHDEKIIGVPTDKVDPSYSRHPRPGGSAGGRTAAHRGLLPRLQGPARPGATRCSSMAGAMLLKRVR